ncbi:hypothetical protein MNBD_ALPHA01-1510 [hydrothermal vent metagenome]|uniref:N-acetyltransferase domain-containing protein n=1 Tax=hydrothermal vent metagenome TaxID=652676 RepID=A0A3B0TE69_9ZZZZ
MQGALVRVATSSVTEEQEMNFNSNNNQIAQGRLRLRPMEVRDAPRVLSYRRHTDVALYQGWTPETVKEVEDYAVKMKNFGDDIYGHWIQIVIECLTISPVEIIGDMAFCIDPETKAQAELGIALDPAFHKNGYGLEATRILMGHLFDHYKLHRIHVAIDPGNRASQKLCQALGFRQEGHMKESSFFKGEWVDDIVMAVLKKEWAK